MAAPNIYQTIMDAESGGKNVKNYMYDSGHTASGYFQITNSTWATTEAGQNSGVKNAMDAPYATQQAAAGELIQRNGLKDWAPYDHINSNVSSYDQTPLSGPNGSPTTGSMLKPATGNSDASTNTYTKNSDGTTTATSANGTKAIAATTPIAIATGADEQSAATTSAATTQANQLQKSTDQNNSAYKTLSQGLYSAAFAGLGDLVGRIGIITVGLVLLAGALYIVAAETGAPIPAGGTIRRVGKTVLA